MKPLTKIRAVTLKDELEAAEAELQAVYRKLWPLREQYAAENPPAELPPPRHRTAKQDLVARCPRCGGRVEEQREPES